MAPGNQFPVNSEREAIKRALDDELQQLDRLFLQIIALRDQVIERARARVVSQ